MPIVASDYRAPFWLRNGHLASIGPSVFRRVSQPSYRRERIVTDDGDYLDLDWASADAAPSSRLVILLHGLEGSSQRPYVRGMARAANQAGWDALAMNFRGCSGQPNRLARSYHGGATEDLQRVIDHAMASRPEAQIGLIGFSLGGNQVLKYLGERSETVADMIVAAVTFSVPVDLGSSSRYLERWAGRAYMRRFVRSLSAKLEAKRLLLPSQLASFDRGQVAANLSLAEFDSRFTAPLHGFEDAQDYWRRCSAGRFLDGIRRPALLVNALDDPFLPAACYPEAVAAEHPWLRLELPQHGGHVGFAPAASDRSYWSERRALSFLADRFSEAKGRRSLT